MKGYNEVCEALAKNKYVLISPKNFSDWRGNRTKITVYCPWHEKTETVLAKNFYPNYAGRLRCCSNEDRFGSPEERLLKHSERVSMWNSNHEVLYDETLQGGWTQRRCPAVLFCHKHNQKVITTFENYFRQTRNGLICCATEDLSPLAREGQKRRAKQRIQRMSSPKARQAYEDRRNWSAKVKRRWNKCCFVSGVSYENSGFLASHHLFSWEDRTDLRTVLNNGIVVNFYLHLCYHELYNEVNPQSFADFCKAFHTQTHPNHELIQIWANKYEKCPAKSEADVDALLSDQLDYLARIDVVLNSADPEAVCPCKRFGKRQVKFNRES